MSAIARLFEAAPVAQAELARLDAVSYGDDVAGWWTDCGRADWMLWAAGAAGVDLRVLVAAALDCARLTLPLIDDEETREIAVGALVVADLWCDGRQGPGECRAAASKVYREAERTVPIADQRAAAARTSALASIEAAVQAAAWSDDRFRCAEFTARSARSVAACWERLDGPDAEETAQLKCADRVRARIQPRHLAPWVQEQ